ncbi:MAG: hypothetical protein AB7G93_04725 [Bdellovibrionales bacterium]
MKKQTILNNYRGLALTLAFAGALTLGSSAVAEDDMMGSMPQQQPSNTMQSDTPDTSDTDHDHEQMKKDHAEMKKDHKKMKKDSKAMKGNNNQMQKMGKKKQMPMNNNGSGMMMMDHDKMGSGKSGSDKSDGNMPKDGMDHM